MKFDEKTAIEIIEKFNLSPSTLKVWKNRNSIPDRYQNEYEKPGVSRSKTVEVEKVLKIVTYDKINRETIIQYSGVSRNKIEDAIRQKTALTDNELLLLKKTINEFRIELNKIIDLLNKSTYEVTEMSQKQILNFLSKKYIVENKVFGSELNKKFSSWKNKRTTFPITEKTKIANCLVVLSVETTI